MLLRPTTRTTRPPTRVDTGAALRFLRMSAEEPSRDYLGRLLLAYRDRVPYETVTRLLSRRDVSEPEDRVRPPARFWKETIDPGTGDSDPDAAYAFKKLLETLGFECAMAVGGGPGSPRESSHSCVIVELDGDRYAIEPCGWHYIKVPLPLGGEERVDLRGRTDAVVPYHYAVEPLGDGHYGVHNIGPDGRPDPQDPTRGPVYTLRDRPLTDEEFEELVRRDHGHGRYPGHLSFARRDWRTKIESRYSSGSGRLERKVWGTWEEADLGDDAAATLATASGLPHARIEEALEHLGTIV